MKGEAAALLVRAQHCQSHYFSTTPRMVLTCDDQCETLFRIVKDKDVVVQVVQQSNEQTTVSKRLWAGYCAFLI